MIKLRRPTDQQLLATLDKVGKAQVTYAAVGSLQRQCPAGFVRDRARVQLGRGERVYQAARQAICQWEMMPPSMVTIVGRDLTLNEGTVVGVLFRALGLWTLNPCRLVYLIDDAQDEWNRFGFAYATLPGHVECGEEHFVCQWHAGTDEVWYDLQADSRPQHSLAWIGYPYARWLQKRFRDLSCRAMQDAVQVALRDSMPSAH